MAAASGVGARAERPGPRAFFARRHLSREQRQERVRVWRTASGRFVVEHLRQTQWVGERDTTAVLVFDSVADLVGWIEQRHRIIADELLEALRRHDLLEPERIE